MGHLAVVNLSVKVNHYSGMQKNAANILFSYLVTCGNENFHRNTQRHLTSTPVRQKADTEITCKITCRFPVLASSETQRQIVGTRKILNRRKNIYGTKKSKERREEPLGTMSYQTSALLAVLYFSSCHIFFRPFRIFLVPTICPWVSEDAVLAGCGHVTDA